MKNHKLLFLLLPLLLTQACNNSQSSKVDYNSLSEEEKHLAANALASMELADGLQATVFASEPMLVNPTNMDIDAKGRVWVIEGLNYRNKYNPDNPYRAEGDRILILEDTNGDGIADNSKVFYQGEDINSALGITVLGNRVIVSHSPNIFIFTDEDGDDKSDKKEVLFTGLSGDQHDHGVHAFTFGPDGKLYFNFGNAGGQLNDRDGKLILDRLGRPVKADDSPYRQGMAFRCDIDGRNVEVLGHNFRNNYELAVDSYGTLWQSDNDDDGNRGVRINYVMPYGNYGYTDEITGAGWRTRRIDMNDSIPLRHWHQNDPGVVPNLLQTGSGSPCGMVVYEGDLLPEVFQNQMIHAEAGHQVTRAYPVKPDGAGYKAEIVNVMKSKNQWHRPSDVCVAPDGSLFVTDWYDPGVGGHKMDDPGRGRIFRIAPTTEYKIPALDLNTTQGAIQGLQSPNLATRYLAWTKLHEDGAAAEAALLDLYEKGKPHQRARALWLLGKIEGKAATYIEKGLSDSDENIRMTALRLAQQEDEANLLSYVQQLVMDKNPQVRREAALALRYQDSPEAANLWAELAAQHDGKDRWYLEALGIGADLHPQPYFNAYLTKVGNEWNTPAGRDIIWRMRSPETVPLLVEIIQDTKLSEKELAHYFRAFHFQPNVNIDAPLAKLLNGNHPHQKLINAYTLSYLSPNFSRQNAAVVERILPTIEGTPEWLDAVKSMQLKNQRPALLTMMLSSEDQTMRREAGAILMAVEGKSFIDQQWQQMDDKQRMELLLALGSINHSDAMNFLTEKMDNKQFPLALRQRATEAIGNSWDGQHYLADLVKANKLDKALATTAALKLINCWDPEVKEVGFGILEEARGKGGVELPPVAELVSLEGNATKGRYVFKTYCATCHVAEDEGIAFGPNLSEIGSKLAKEAIYTSIFYPSAGINFGYEGFIVKTKDGSVFSGYIESDTQEKLTLRMMGGNSQEILKSNIASQEAMDESLMTANLQAAMTQEELVDLVEYLSSLKTPERLSSK